MYLERLLLYHAMLYSYMTNTLFSLARLSLSVSGSPGHFLAGIDSKSEENRAKVTPTKNKEAASCKHV